jgi:UTP--glucose-1-phosphate uridylyltransferase
VKINKAVITAAGRNQNRLPLQVLVDCDGAQKAAIRIIFEEVLSAGVEEVCLVISPGDEEPYASALVGLSCKIHYVQQPEPRGYGHALLCARPLVGSDPFLHLVSDHLYLSGQAKRCAQQLVEVATSHACSVSAVQATREGMLPYYGVVGGKGIEHKDGLYQVEKVLEKPTPTIAEQEAIVPGLRAGHYLCFFGMHVLTGTLMQILSDQSGKNPKNLALSPALNELAAREKYLAAELEGRRYNLGVKFGVFTAQLALALVGADREEVLAQLVEILASRPGPQSSSHQAS